MHKKPRKVRNISIIIGLIIAGMLLFEFSPFGYNIPFYSKWISCGQKPVATAGPGFWGEGVKHYYTPATFTLARGRTLYFCTPIQAERAGYSANENFYDFPHIKAAGESGPPLEKVMQGYSNQG